MKQMNTRIILTLLLFIAGFTRAAAQTVPGDDFMRSMGKMYVVVAAIVAIFLGIVLFMIYLERRLTKLENQTKEHD